MEKYPNYKDFAEIIISISHSHVDRIFHYKVPDTIRDTISPGYRVLVPFGSSNKTIEGFIIGFSKPNIELSKIKNIIRIVDDYPLITPPLLELAAWMKDKYYTTFAACLKCILPSGISLKNVLAGRLIKKVRYVKLNIHNDNFHSLLSDALKKTGAQSDVLNLILQNNSLPLSTVLKTLNISVSPVNTLLKKGLLVFDDIEILRDVINQTPSALASSINLTHQQNVAVKLISDAFYDPHKKPFLIHGVTGSGKTEIYLKLIEHALKQNMQAIMLVPEISLTPQAIDAFINRFGNKVTVTHSRLSPAERLDQWKKARDSSVSVIIGPRSAIFTPFQNLGIIIIDEEHEKSYKSETTPKYCVREVAEKLSEITGCILVLGSATPDVCSFHKASSGTYELVTLSHRINNRPPDIYISDMRFELASGNRSIFSKALFEAISENIKAKQQTILFMNRRGYSTFVSCRSCGYVLKCDFCNVNYTYHISNNILLCHYCARSQIPPQKCPACDSPYIRYFGAGTQKIEEEINSLFPEASSIRMDMDTTSGKNSHKNIIQKFASGETDILIGTQMIAKGLNFPNVSLVGILAADTALNSGDFNSAETAFQLITQVSGRAGRAELPGRVFIQTYNPEHYSINFAKTGDYLNFYEHEIKLREVMNYPPFSNLFLILLSGENEKNIVYILNKLSELMSNVNRKGFFDILGPAPAIISKINGLFRWKIIVKGSDESLLKQFVFYCINKIKNSKAFDLSGITFNFTLNPRTLA